MKVLILAEFFLAFVCLQLQCSESKEPYSYWTPKTTKTRLYHPTQNVKDAGVRRRIQGNNENYNTLYQYPDYQSQASYHRYEHEYPTESYQEQYYPLEKASEVSLLGKITQFFKNGMRKLRTVSVRNIVGDWANSNLERQGIQSIPPLAAFVAFTTAVGLGGIAAQTGIVNQMIDVMNNILNPTITTTTTTVASASTSDVLDQVVQVVVQLGEIEGRSSRQEQPAFGTLAFFIANKAKYISVLSEIYDYDPTLMDIELSSNSLSDIIVTFRIKDTSAKTRLQNIMDDEASLISNAKSQLASIGLMVGSIGFLNGAFADVEASCNNGLKDSNEGDVDCGPQCGVSCDACQADTCANEGTCTTITYEKIQVSACECDSPWSGPYCHENACTGQLCSGVGTCSAYPFDDCEADICQRIVNSVNIVNEPNTVTIGKIHNYQACDVYINDEDIYEGSGGNFIQVPSSNEWGPFVPYLENCEVGTVNEQEYSMSINRTGISVTVFRNYGLQSIGIYGKLLTGGDGLAVKGTNEYSKWKGFWKITSECHPMTGEDCNESSPTLHHLWVTDAPITSANHLIPSGNTRNDSDILNMVNGHNVVYFMWATQAGDTSSEAVMLELVQSVANSFGSCQVGGYGCSCNAGYAGNDCEYGPCAVNNGGCEQTCTDNNGIAVCSCDTGTLNVDGKSCNGDGDCSPQNWIGYNGTTCGSCSAIVSVMNVWNGVFQGEVWDCSKFCRMQSLNCVDGWDYEGDGTCEGEQRGCEYEWDGYSTSVCQCSDVETCDDGIKNRDEDNVDCGGTESICSACGECQDDANPVPELTHTCTNQEEGPLCEGPDKRTLSFFPSGGKRDPSCFELSASGLCDLPWFIIQGCFPEERSLPDARDYSADQHILVKDTCKRSCKNCDGEARCCTTWSSTCYTDSNANSNYLACNQYLSTSAYSTPCLVECFNPSSDNCKVCCTAPVHDTTWNCAAQEDDGV